MSLLKCVCACGCLRRNTIKKGRQMPVITSVNWLRNICPIIEFVIAVLLKTFVSMTAHVESDVVRCFAEFSTTRTQD